MHEVGLMTQENLPLRRVRGANRRRDSREGLDFLAGLRSLLRGMKKTSLAFKRESRAGLSSFDSFAFIGFGPGRLGGETETPLAMSCQTFEPGFKRKPSP